MASSDGTTQTTTVQEIADATITRLLAAGLIQPKGAKRKRVNWEREISNEYLARFYPEMPHWTRIEVGPMPKGENADLYSRTRRWADAVVREPDNMLIVEFKMRANQDVVGQLMNYRQLLPQTPMFIKYKDLPVKCRVVAAMCDEQIKALIEGNGIELEMFQPRNYEKWYTEKILKKQEK